MVRGMAQSVVPELHGLPGAPRTPVEGSGQDSSGASLGCSPAERRAACGLGVDVSAELTASYQGRSHLVPRLGWAPPHCVVRRVLAWQTKMRPRPLRT
jgi:hypothetical protein